MEARLVPHDVSAAEKWRRKRIKKRKNEMRTEMTYWLSKSKHSTNIH